MLRAMRRVALFGSVLVALGACRSTGVASARSTSAPAFDTMLGGAEDTALLSEVVRGLRREQLVPTGRVIVDPRPLLAGEGSPEISPSVFARVPPAIFQSRATALRSVGVEPGDAAAPLQGCAGAMVPYPPPGEPDPKRNCPSQTLFPIAVSLARAGTAKLRPGNVYDGITSRAVEGYWAVRVAVGNVGPGGKVVQYYDVVMRKDGATWTYVKAVPGVIWE
jgi:hypothetical protein